MRDAGRAADLVALGVEPVTGDLHNANALRQLLEGSDAVIHGAGAVRGASQADFDRVNVEGTAAVLEAAAALDPPPRLLLLSSLAAREPQLSWYARSKREAERLLQARDELDWLVLRPPAVYGPGDQEMLAVFQTMARGLATVPGSPESRISLIHVADLAEAILCCLRSEGAGHQTLTLCDGKPGGYDWHELAAEASRHWGRKVRLWPVPGWLLDAVARVNLWAAGLTGRAPMLTPAKLRELRHPDWVVDNREISEITGWKPQTGLAEGLSTLAI